MGECCHKIKSDSSLTNYRFLLQVAEATFKSNKANLILLANPYCLLGMWCLIPLLENIDFLMQFALQHDVFICDLVFVIKICQGSFIHYTMMAIHHFPMMNYEHLKFGGF
ncbi:hypothetical protein BDL97_05G034100 [Sphagnum fallax]|nr:hypothetical protein BDL97_05G034100 [Sphagnum fallax]